MRHHRPRAGLRALLEKLLVLLVYRFLRAIVSSHSMVPIQTQALHRNRLASLAITSTGPATLRAMTFSAPNLPDTQSRSPLMKHLKYKCSSLPPLTRRSPLPRGATTPTRSKAATKTMRILMSTMSSTTPVFQSSAPRIGPPLLRLANVKDLCPMSIVPPLHLWVRDRSHLFLRA